jgi:hypothetical protein
MNKDVNPQLYMMIWVQFHRDNELSRIIKYVDTSKWKDPLFNELVEEGYQKSQKLS